MKDGDPIKNTTGTVPSIDCFKQSHQFATSNITKRQEFPGPNLNDTKSILQDTVAFDEQTCKPKTEVIVSNETHGDSDAEFVDAPDEPEIFETEKTWFKSTPSSVYNSAVEGSSEDSRNSKLENFDTEMAEQDACETFLDAMPVIPLAGQEMNEEKAMSEPEPKRAANESEDKILHIKSAQEFGFKSRLVLQSSYPESSNTVLKSLVEMVNQPVRERSISPETKNSAFTTDSENERVAIVEDSSESKTFEDNLEHEHFHHFSSIPKTEGMGAELELDESNLVTDNTQVTSRINKILPISDEDGTQLSCTSYILVENSDSIAIAAPEVEEPRFLNKSDAIEEQKIEHVTSSATSENVEIIYDSEDLMSNPSEGGTALSNIEPISHEYYPSRSDEFMSSVACNEETQLGESESMEEKKCFDIADDSTAISPENPDDPSSNEEMTSENAVESNIGSTWPSENAMESNIGSTWLENDSCSLKPTKSATRNSIFAEAILSLESSCKAKEEKSAETLFEDLGTESIPSNSLEHKRRVFERDSSNPQLSLNSKKEDEGFPLQEKPGFLSLESILQLQESLEEDYKDFVVDENFQMYIEDREPNNFEVCETDNTASDTTSPMKQNADETKQDCRELISLVTVCNTEKDQENPNMKEEESDTNQNVKGKNDDKKDSLPAEKSVKPSRGQELADEANVVASELTRRILETIECLKSSITPTKIESMSIRELACRGKIKEVAKIFTEIDSANNNRKKPETPKGNALHMTESSRSLNSLTSEENERTRGLKEIICKMEKVLQNQMIDNQKQNFTRAEWSQKTCSRSTETPLTLSFSSPLTTIPEEPAESNGTLDPENTPLTSSRIGTSCSSNVEEDLSVTAFASTISENFQEWSIKENEQEEQHNKGLVGTKAIDSSEQCSEAIKDKLPPFKDPEPSSIPDPAVEEETASSAAESVGREEKSTPSAEGLTEQTEVKPKSPNVTCEKNQDVSSGRKTAAQSTVSRHPFASKKHEKRKLSVSRIKFNMTTTKAKVRTTHQIINKSAAISQSTAFQSSVTVRRSLANNARSTLQRSSSKTPQRSNHSMGSKMIRPIRSDQTTLRSRLPQLTETTSLYRRLPTPQTKAKAPSPVSRAMNPSLKANSPPKPILPLSMKSRVEASRSRVGPYAKKVEPKVISNADDDAAAEKKKHFHSKLPEVPSENLLESKIISGSEALLILSEKNVEDNGGIQATESNEVPQTEEAVPSTSSTLAKLYNQFRDESKATAVDEAAEEGKEDEISNSDFEVASETNSEKSTLTSDKVKYLKASSKIAAPTGVPSAKLSSLMSRFKVGSKRYETYVKELKAARERVKNVNDSLRIIRGQMIAASGDAPQGFVIPDLPTENLSPEVQTSHVDDSIVKALETETLRLKELLHKKSEENNSQAGKLHELRCETKLLEHRVSVLKDHNEDLKSTLKEEVERQTKSIMAELEKANQQLKKEVQGKLSLEKKKTSEINHLNIKLQCEETKREVLQKNVTQQSKETDQLRSEIDALNAKIKTLESKLEEKNRHNENKEKEENEEIKILSAELGKKVDAVTVLERNLTQEQKYSTELKRQLEELEKERNENSQKVIQLSKMLIERTDLAEENNDKQTKYLQQRNEIGKLLCEICSAIGYKMDNESSNKVKNGFEGDGEEFFNKIKNDVQKLINEKNEQVEKQENLNANMTEAYKEKQKLIDELMDFANSTNARTYAKDEKVKELTELGVEKTTSYLGKTMGLLPSKDGSATPSFTDLFTMLEIKRHTLSRMERQVKELQEVHSYCGMRRTLQESRIAELELELAATSCKKQLTTPMQQRSPATCGMSVKKNSLEAG